MKYDAEDMQAADDQIDRLSAINQRLRAELTACVTARDEANAAWAAKLNGLEAAVRAEIAWHENEALMHREHEAEAELYERENDLTAGESLDARYAAEAHETAADRLLAIPLTPKPKPELKF